MPTHIRRCRSETPFRRALAWTVTLLAWFVAAWARAADFHYEVELVVPSAYRSLLEENLEIMKWRTSPQADLDFLRRLYAQAPAQIESLLATEGFYSPRIESSLKKRGEIWVARFDVQPGEPVRVAAVALDFDGPITAQSPEARPRIADLRGQWSLKVGARFRQTDWEAAKRALLRALVVERYPAARIADSQAVVDPKRREARLRMRVDSGPAFSFGSLEMEGLSRYPASVIERLNPITRGSPYSQAQVLELQRRLQATGYFKSVVVTVDTDPAHAGAAPLRVKVTETESKKLSLGAGLSTDTGPRGKIEYSDLNVRQRGWRFRGGIEVDRVTQSVGAELNFPPQAGGARDSITSSYSHQDLVGQTTRTARLGINRAQRQGSFDRVLSLQYQYENQAVAGAASDIRQAVFAGSSWMRRRTDDPIYPTRGYLLNFQLGGALKSLLSDQTFVRGYTQGVRYFPFGASGTLLLRGELGVVQAQSSAGIPSDFLFRTGGDRSVRGYAYQSLGVPLGDAIVGGRYLAVASTEYDYWFLPRWGAAVFYDAGNAADSISDFRFAQGYGVGARWRSPVGPVNLDVAYGQARHAYRVHFAMGFAF